MNSLRQQQPQQQRFTRKVSQANRRNPEKELQIDLHIMLNRIDVEKDAVYTSVPIRDRTLFHAHADELFGPLPARTYAESVARMKDIVKKYTSEKAFVVHIEEYEVGKLTEIEIVPSYVTVGVQDAGISPKTYIPAIEILVTPGSYIDRCDRTKGSIVYGFNRPLNERDCKDLGMSVHVKGVVPTLYSDGSCRIVVQRPGTTIDALFNNAYKPIVGDVAYFQGNREKNTWFNTDGADRTKAHSLILVKELGDTLQAYYARLYIDSTRADRRSVCLFTNDEILTMRCQILFVPVLYNVNADKTDKLFYFYPVMDHVHTEFIRMYRSNLSKNNKVVIENIASVLAKKYCMYPNGRIVRFTQDSGFAKVLQECITEIQKQTATFLTYPIDTYQIEQVRRLSKYFHAVRIFNEKGVLNTGARALFITPTRDTRVFRDPWGAVVQRLVAQTGGGDNEDVEIAPPPYSIPDYIHVTEDEAQLSHIKTCNAIFAELHTDYPEKPVDEVYAHVENIHMLLYCYFGYIAESTSFKGFIVRLVDMYMDGTLWMSYKEFEDMFASWSAEYDRLHPPIPRALVPPPTPSMDDVIADLLAFVAAPAATLAVASASASAPRPMVLVHGGGPRNQTRCRRKFDNS